MWELWEGFHSPKTDVEIYFTQQLAYKWLGCFITLLLHR